MTPLKIDLSYNYPKNYRRIFLGVTTIILAGGSMFQQIKSSEVLSTGRFLMFLGFFFLGLLYLWLGLGKNPFTVLGTAFLSIDDEKIILKNTRFSKEDVIDLNSILKIDIKVSSIRIVAGNNTAYEFAYDHIDEEIIKKLKSTLVKLCKERNISLG